MNEQSAKVMPPTSMTITEGAGATWKMGASFTSRNTPAFTMVDECSRALVGVGATMAPRSQVWKGICAAFVMPAKARAQAARVTSAGLLAPMTRKSKNENVPTVIAQEYSATKKPRPPARFMMIWRKALAMASSVRV